MSRHPRDYPVADGYDDRESEFYRRPRRDRDYDDLEVDITRTQFPESRRAETMVKERDTVVSDRRTERGPRQPDFLREDYGKSSTAGPLVVREERDDEVYSRVSRRRRSLETVRSRAPTEKVEKDKFVFEERETSDRGPPYPRSQRSELDSRGRGREEEATKIIFRERTRSRPPPREEREKDEIDITIRRDESRPAPPRSPPPIEEIRFRRGGGDRPAPPRSTVEKTEIDIRESSRPPPPRSSRTVVDREEIDIRETRSSAPPPRREVEKEEIIFRERRSPPRGREVIREEIDIRETSRPPPRPRSMSRPNLVARKEEEWIVRRPRTPPPKDYEREEIIIRHKKERTPSPEPPREPTPEPSPPPPPLPEPIYRPPIIQEVITHHRHIDHGVERARSPTPPPPPPSPPKPETKEDDLEIEIKRKGTRNGKAYEEDIHIDIDHKDREEQPSREMERYEERKRDMSVVSRRRSPSPRRRYDDELAGEAEYYNRKIASRAYPGEAYNGATRDWSLVDVPPGTERVRMDGIGGGAQEIYWDRYSGSRRGKFISGDRVYEDSYGNGYSSPPPLPPAPPREREVDKEEIKITHTHTSGGNEGRSRSKRDKMWTEVTKDLVIKEACDEMGYEYEETDDFFYVMEYLKYEDVLRLVEITEDIKRERRERIREIQWEREERERVPKMLPPPPVPAPPRSRYDERIYEREYYHDRDGRRYR